MADQNVNELSTATPALTDYIMGIGSSAEYKALVSAVAKKIVEDYTGSSLAGSSQSVKAALDGLNSKSVAITAESGVTIQQNHSVRNGKLVAINAYFQCDSVTAGTAITVGTVEDAARPYSEAAVVAYDNFSRAICTGWINTGGQIKLIPPATATNRSLRASFCYMSK